MSRQRIAVAGSSGLIGGALSAFLTARGDEVVRLVRRAPRRPDEVRWDPAAGRLDPTALDGVDAVVNLAGAGIADRRWSAASKEELRRSRLGPTTTLARTLARLGRPVRLVNGSAVGAYGDRGDEVLTVDAPRGRGFLADLVRDWEEATAPAAEAGCPTALARTGIVLSSHGGALERVLPLARLGLAGPLGSGRQWWPWISLDDEVRALVHLVDHPELTGPVDLAAPHPARQREVTAELGRLLHRPAVLPVPRMALRAVLGEVADDLTGGQRVHPTGLLDAGFVWQHPHPVDALRAVLAGRT